MLQPAGQAWRDALSAQMFRLMHVIEEDNFDPIRFRGTSAKVFFFERYAAYLAFVVNS